MYMVSLKQDVIPQNKRFTTIGTKSIRATGHIARVNIVQSSFLPYHYRLVNA